MANSYISIDESIKKLFQLVDEHPEYFLSKKKNLAEAKDVQTFFKKVEQYKSEGDLPLKILFNSIDIIYKSIKSKYKDYFLPGRIEELLAQLKDYSETNNKVEFQKLRQRIKLLLINIETQIKTSIPDYKLKFTENV